MTRPLVFGVAAMAFVIVVSNILVQHPVGGTLGGVALADLLTYGAFTYPAAFFVTDILNRYHGPRVARRVAVTGFVVALAASVVIVQLQWLNLLGEGFLQPRIVIASAIAFISAQLLDVSVFDRLRTSNKWWLPPAVSSFVGSALDTVLFFGLAFAASVTLVLGGGDGFATASAPFLGVFAVETPRWISWAVADFGVKLLTAALLLIPYRVIQILRRDATAGA